MNVSLQGSIVQITWEASEYSPHAAVALLQWCRDNAGAHDYSHTATHDYELRDFGEGFERGEPFEWELILDFEKDDDATAFRLAVDGILEGE